MTHSNQSNDEHPVDQLLGKALCDTVPPDTELRLLERVEQFKPAAHHWRLPVSIGGALAACVAIAVVWGLMSINAQPAHAWEQMQATLAQPAHTIQLWITQETTRREDGRDVRELNARALYRAKVGLGSRLDAYKDGSKAIDGRILDKITFIRSDNVHEVVDYEAQKVERIRGIEFPPVGKLKPDSIDEADAYIQRLVTARNATLVGEEQIRGQRTLCFSVPAEQIVARNKYSSANSHESVFVWVNDESHLPVKWQMKFEYEYEGGLRSITLTYDEYVRDQPIDDGVFDLPKETADWDHVEYWSVNLTSDADLATPLQIQVGLVDDDAWFTEQDFTDSAGRTDLAPKAWRKLKELTKQNQGKVLQVKLNGRMIMEHTIDWPIERITVFGKSHQLK